MIAADIAQLFINSLSDRNCVLAGRFAVISCSDTAPETSLTTHTQTQTELALGGAAVNSVSTPPVAVAKLDLMFGQRRRADAFACNKLKKSAGLSIRTTA